MKPFHWPPVIDLVPSAGANDSMPSAKPGSDGVDLIALSLFSQMKWMRNYIAIELTASGRKSHMMR
ncbi:MAG: hypothetical protein WB676_23125 [Bryobacteraceae bacterium]